MLEEPRKITVRAKKHAALTLTKRERQMSNGQKDGSSPSSASSKAPRPEPRRGRWSYLMGWSLPRSAATEVVATSVRFDASSETVWQRVLMYEEVPARPPLLLRALLPQPVRTEGDKTRVGAAVQCTYSGGHLLKRIKIVEPPHLLEFEVIEQRLGIEGRVTIAGGSYEIRSCGDQTEVVLTTNYRGHMRPRYFWRVLERLLAHQLHRYILEGMRASFPRLGSSARAAVPESPMPKSIHP